MNKANGFEFLDVKSVFGCKFDVCPFDTVVGVVGEARWKSGLSSVKLC
jgi:hypothetical protein